MRLELLSVSTLSIKAPTTDFVVVDRDILLSIDCIGAYDAVEDRKSDRRVAMTSQEVVGVGAALRWTVWRGVEVVHVFSL